ncbi:hypothetical protein JSQ81_13580 [Sporosarcina sp. Marseille-Q4063]|uniref:DUF5694 domain-containing protein n=1 Tax=Sporosarcina sp. Marseille-Q4063 TaxID=2810514 RepID=UPI001BAFEDB4|nr:DUF5694 domain-containing protein [Sporosarcina sp. Marseille-Q4063]QUW20844.1 hypothetical protein JSQ81_13580 [Sporosarcina sp. Marseille-Q4063]
MKPQVMVVGVYHLGNTTDLINVESKNDNVLKQQAKEVVDALSRFNPTKLAVEAEWEVQSQLNDSYRKYQLGKLTPTKNEIEMIGFPLAQKSDISEVSCVDWRGDDSENAPLGDILQYAKEYEPERYKKIMNMYIEPMQREAEEWPSLSILEGFTRVNEADTVKKLHEIYMELAMIGREKDYYAMEWLTWWYKRNLILYSNVRRLITSPQDRVLLLIGGSHVHLVKQFLKESGGCTVVDANEYLK